ncbi:MAG: endonuclease V [Chloroflexi bacterium]|nr:endonuclease V [Chloroflexota bacterium]|tara:strand:- start:3705 stop:4115 length:411 start_codon:yes stop_codon:yes gene_type:complete
MTRINIVPVEELMDQHLIAEYREITMIPASLKRTIESKEGLKLSKISKNYTLNKGHVYFFYNKGKYLSKRYELLAYEMTKRGFKPNKNRKFPVEIFKNNGLFNDWSPSQHEYKIIRERINTKINKNPKWYRKTEKN